ncbi:MAG: hypothetical protein AAGK21_07630 [Bacteroidota bacterium]
MSHSRTAKLLDTPIQSKDVLKSPPLLLGAAAGVFPGLDASGFTPLIGLDPLAAILLAATGGAIAGALAGVSSRARGAITGVLMCAGMTAGLLGYVYLRTTVLPTDTFLRLEIAVGLLIGCIPGVVLMNRWFDVDVTGNAGERAES